MPEPIRVLLADDHPLVREGLRHSLQKLAGIVLVGEAADGNEVKHLCHDLRPDVLLLDLNMPGPPPLELVAELNNSCPGTKILILSAYDNLVSIPALLALGISGYVLKDEATQVVAQAIQIVSQGRTWFSAAVVQRVVHLKPSELAMEDFTPREAEVLHLLARGWPNTRIAEVLGVSERTVRYHLQNIQSKLNMTSRSEVLTWAIERNLADK